MLVAMPALEAARRLRDMLLSSTSILISAMEVSGEESAPGNQKVKGKEVKTMELQL